MKIYFASYSTSREILEVEGDFGVLVSYVEIKKRGLEKLKIPCVLDSGAFSVFTGKSKHTIDDYIKFCHKNKHNAEWYANFDVIGNAKETYQNQKEMERQGLKPVPTFHYGSDIKWLKKYKDEYEFIGLGGLVPYAKQKNKLYRHLDKCFSIVRDSVKIHGWGMTGMETLKRYPFYSVDSTSWLFGGKMGKRYDYTFNSMAGCDNLAKVIHYKELNIHNAKQFLKLKKDITKLWEKRGIKWGS